MSTGTWQHVVVVVRKSQKASFWVDGVESVSADNYGLFDGNLGSTEYDYSFVGDSQ